MVSRQSLYDNSPFNLSLSGMSTPPPMSTTPLRGGGGMGMGYYDPYGSSSLGSYPTFMTSPLQQQQPLTSSPSPFYQQQQQPRSSPSQQQMLQSPTGTGGGGSGYGASTFALASHYNPMSPLSMAATSPTSPLSPLQQQQQSFYFQQQQYEPYFQPSVISQRKSDGFEPMNTSPTLQQQQFSPLSRSTSSPTIATGAPVYLPAYFTGESSFHAPLSSSNSPPRSSTMLRGSPSSSSGRVLFDSTTPKGGSKAKAEASSAIGGSTSKKPGPPIFGFGSCIDDDDDGRRFLSTSSGGSSPNLLLERSGLSCGSANGGGGGDGAGSATAAATPSQRLSMRPSAFAALGAEFQQHPTPSPPTAASTATTSQWVTVFGFSVASTPFVISHFSSFGTIVETKSVPGSNWLHLKFSNKFEAKRALNKNGMTIGGNMMIGILPYDEVAGAGAGPGADGVVKRSTTTTDRPAIYPLEYLEPSTSSKASGAAVSSAATGGAGSATTAVATGPSPFSQHIKARLRPLARGSAYMGDTNSLPRESNGIISRVLEFLFGW